MGVSRSSVGLSVPAIVAEIGGAIVGGVLMVPVFFLVVSLLFQGAGLGMGLLSLQVFAAVIGFGFGAGLGAAIAGRLLGQSGSWWLAALLGAVTGVLVILALRLFNLNSGGLFGIFWVGAPLALLAAVAGYNLRRRP